MKGTEAVAGMVHRGDRSQGFINYLPGNNHALVMFWGLVTLVRMQAWTEFPTSWKKVWLMRSFTLNGKTGTNFQLINDFPAYLCTPIPLRLQFSPFCTQYPQKEQVAHWSLKCLAQHT